MKKTKKVRNYIKGDFCFLEELSFEELEKKLLEVKLQKENEIKEKYEKN
jgi:hypothetical protein